MTEWPMVAYALVIVAASLFVERFYCRFAKSVCNVDVGHPAHVALFTEKGAAEAAPATNDLSAAAQMKSPSQSGSAGQG